MLFGVAPLLGQVVLSDVPRDGSSLQTHDMGNAVTTTDAWFRPVNIPLGPDDALYMADCYDGQIGHYHSHEGQFDPSSGRIYRLGAKQATSSFRAADLSAACRHPRWSALRLIPTGGCGRRHCA